jgi:hypothetical protein
MVMFMKPTIASLVTFVFQLNTQLPVYSSSEFTVAEFAKEFHENKPILVEELEDRNSSHSNIHTFWPTTCCSCTINLVRLTREVCKYNTQSLTNVKCSELSYPCIFSSSMSLLLLTRQRRQAAV